MAQVTFTTYNETKFLPAFLAELRAGLVPLNALTTKFDVSGRRKGEAMIVGKYTGAAAATRVLGANGVGGGAITGVSMTLPDPLHVQWEIPDGVGGAVEFERMGMVMAKRLAKAVVAVPFANVTATNFGSADEDVYVKAAGDFGSSAIADLGAKATTKNLENPKLVLNGSYYWQLVKDLGIGIQDKQMLTTGILPDIGGMNCYKYAELPDNSENLVGCVIDPTSILVALAPVVPEASAGQGDLISYEIVTDEEGSVAMTYKRWYSSNPGVMYGRMEVMAISAVGNDGIVRIVSEV